MFWKKKHTYTRDKRKVFVFHVFSWISKSSQMFGNLEYVCKQQNCTFLSFAKYFSAAWIRGKHYVFFFVQNAHTLKVWAGKVEWFRLHTIKWSERIESEHSLKWQEVSSKQQMFTFHTCTGGHTQIQSLQLVPYFTGKFFFSLSKWPKMANFLKMPFRWITHTNDVQENLCTYANGHHFIIRQKWICVATDNVL